ncbi:MAG TPA: beta-ketoacyl-[acyl-carrier-protein] synthase family protein [Thermoanaerobaculia bacterium]|nr:beta-ketoacyl-[acyl-carrier-protein] synthase family protein [Thermoanaerobaculia bacterium]
MSGAAVAITGLGAVSGYGAGTAALWRGLLSGRTAIGTVRRFDSAAYRTHVASEVPDAACAAPPRARLSLADRFALSAAAEALGQAGLPARLDELRAGLFFGSSTGGMLESEEFYARLLARAEAEGAPRPRLGGLVSQPPSGPGDAVARAHGVTGPVETVASACASATLALGAALEALRAGEVDLVLAGGSDSFCRLTFAGFNSLRAVDELPCRPFRIERLGMTIGEGAAVLVLETRERAAARGARPLAWLAGVGASCDAHHMTAPDPEGDGISRAVAAALADAGRGPGSIDFVDLHGTGTPANDAAEARMLRRVFGARATELPATSTKACVGHFLGAAGAIEAVATVLGLEHGLVHPTPGEGTLDPELGVDLVVGSARQVAGARTALSTNLAFGGANAACVLLHAEAG